MSSTRVRPFAFALLFCLAACRVHGGSGSGPEVKGDGVSKTESRSVAAFDAIEITAPVSLVLTTGPVAVSIRGDENVLPLVTTTVADGKLVVDATGRFESSGPVVLEVHAPAVARIAGKGSGKVTARGIAVTRFALDMRGAADVTLAGHADRVDIDLGGAGNVVAGDLTAKEGHVHLDGMGNVEVNATDTLETRINGAGVVSYRGKPALMKTGSGLGTVVPLS
jgi:hypothetical protein